MSAKVAVEMMPLVKLSTTRLRTLSATWSEARCSDHASSTTSCTSSAPTRYLDTRASLVRVTHYMKIVPIY